jgi:hypothetical protein
VGGGKKSLEEGVTGRGGGGAAALGFAGSGFSLCERADAAEVLRGAVERERASVVDEIRVVGAGCWMLGVAVTVTVTGPLLKYQEV